MNANTSGRSEAGVLFPASSEGKRGSTEAAKALLAEAVRAVDPQAARSLLSERRWRSRYPPHLVHQEKLAACHAPTATHIAAKGLDAVHEAFEFGRGDTVLSLTDAMTELVKPRFRTATVRGKSELTEPRLEIPYWGKRLSGDELLRQLDLWCSRGIIETSHAEAVRTVMRNPEWLDLSGRTFILLGAGAEIGPLEFLAAHRASIVAVDIDQPEVWMRIFEIVSRSPGVLHVPVHKSYIGELSDRELTECAGADLLERTPEIATWLESFDNSVAVGCYAYAHGKRHVRVVVAMDALVRWLHARGSSVAFAYLASATDAFAVPEEAVQCAHDRYDARGLATLWQSPLRWMTRGRLYAPNIPESVTSDEGTRYGIYDGLVTRQGPNYALAKRIQRWRALVARKSGQRTSANVAPPSMTKSVTSNRAFAAAYSGARHYGAEIFAPETTNALMGTLLVYDLCSESSVANPEIPLSNPLELFMSGANHGGLWRSPLKIRSVLEVAAVRGLLRR